MMQSSDACVLRSTSVSSMRRIIVPAALGALAVARKSQLKMNVRALPICR